jgi:uncharacterized repeat protein (TIGR02543 family)
VLAGAANIPFPAPPDMFEEGHIYGFTLTGGALILNLDKKIVMAELLPTYTVTYNANGGGGSAPPSQTVYAGTGITAGSGSGLSRDGYTFSGWNTAAGGTGTSYAAGGSLTISGNITLYAQWSVNPTYTVTFDAAGGSPATQTRTVIGGTSLGSSGMPSEPVKSGYSFGGWYTAANGGGSEFTAATPVIGDITVYAWWGVPNNLSLDEALTWISNNAETGGAYTIVLQNNEAIAPKLLDYSGKMVGITLTGGTTERLLILSAAGSLFTVGNMVTLTLDNNITLLGRNNNTASLVKVNSGGTLVMNTGAAIRDNTLSSSSTSSHSYSYGGGVYVDSWT